MTRSWDPRLFSAESLNSVGSLLSNLGQDTHGVARGTVGIALLLFTSRYRAAGVEEELPPGRILRTTGESNSAEKPRAERGPREDHGSHP